MEEAVAPPPAVRDPAAGRLRALDSLRGIAALIVFLGHGLTLCGFFPGTDLGSRIGRRLISLLDGAAAVDFFFVLSAFVLTLPYVGPRARPLQVDDFILRRICRIMPTYWAGLSIALLLRAWLGPRSAGLGIGGPIGMDWSLPMTRTDLIEHYLLIFGMKTILVDGPIWSLTVEMQMSMLLPFVIALAALRQSRAGLCALLGVSLLIPYYVRGTSGIPFFSLFVLGCLMASYRDELIAAGRNRSKGERLASWLIALALIWNRALQRWWVWPDLRQEYLSALGAAMVILLVLSRPATPRVLALAPVTFLGDISYSLYLIHVPVVIATLIALHGRVPAIAAVAVAILAAFVVSTLLYYLAEKPSIALGRALARRLSANASSVRAPG